MAKLVFIGAAQAISQIDTITLAGTFASTETVTIKVAEKLVKYTCGSGETPTTVATALLALCQASTDPEFGEITWTSAAGVITATSDPGVPVTITTSDTAASGSSTLASVQAATGPNHWNNAANWSTGSVPANTDEVYFEDDTLAAMYGLPSSLTLNKMEIRLGQIGIPDRNPAGYSEYRTKRAIIGCVNVIIGVSQGVGPSLVRLDLSTSVAIVAVFGSKSRTDVAAIDLLTNDSGATVSIISGQVGIAMGGDETSTLASARVASGGALVLGGGVTITTLLSAGNTVISAAVTTLTVDSGTTTLSGSAAVTNLNVRGGTVVHKTSGTVTSAEVGPGVLDASQDIRARTITDLELRKGGQFDDPYNSITVTNGITLGSDADRLVAQ